ncbi:MAG: hypothetical protein K6D02_03045 [Lachnospiraceae bacterium]|nr:hypothetical protein [Lachnospiraceae bacterium]
MPGGFMWASNLAKRSFSDARRSYVGIDFGEKKQFRCPAVLSGHRIKQKVSFSMPGGFMWASNLAKRSFSDALHFPAGIDFGEKKQFRCPSVLSGHRI